MKRIIPAELKLFDSVYSNDFPDNQYYIILFGDMPSKLSTRTTYNTEILEHLKKIGFEESFRIENTKKNYDIAVESLYINKEKEIIIRADLSTERKTQLIYLEFYYNLNNGEINLRTDKTGDVNYMVFKESNTKDTKDPLHVKLKQISVNNVHVNYLNDQSNKRLSTQLKAMQFSGDFNNHQYALASKGDFILTQYTSGNVKLIKNKAIILIPDTHPNSFNKGLLVNANTKNPMAAVILQNKVTIPILPTI